MRVSIAGAGQVGRSIARELIANGHHVTLIERESTAIKPDSVLGATWLHADACELSSLEEAGLEHYDVAIAATGDDKVNLVHSLLAKTEFGVPRTVSRVNHPGNEWLFDEQWGVDAAVSTPRLMAALVEEAVEAGDLVRILSFKESGTHLSEVTLAPESPFIGSRVAEVALPDGVSLVALLRGTSPQEASSETVLQVGDKLFFLTADASESDLGEMFAPDDDE
jgi:trk system potassium uptake protein